MQLGAHAQGKEKGGGLLTLQLATTEEQDGEEVAAKIGGDGELRWRSSG
jgi:hypothetical protein